MAVDGSGRVRLLGPVQLLHPEQQTFDDMLAGVTAEAPQRPDSLQLDRRRP
jgi:hypothetical protein